MEVYMKLSRIVIVMFLCIVAITTVSCSRSHTVKIDSINEFGDALKEKYEVVEGYKIVVNESGLDFIVEINDPSINSESLILKTTVSESLVLKTIVNEVKILFSNEDIQTDFIEKHNEYYEHKTDIVDDEHLKWFPDVKITIRVNKSKTAITYWSFYYKWDAEIGIQEIDKYNTWTEADYFTQ